MSRRKALCGGLTWSCFTHTSFAMLWQLLETVQHGKARHCSDYPHGLIVLLSDKLELKLLSLFYV